MGKKTGAEGEWRDGGWKGRGLSLRMEYIVAKAGLRFVEGGGGGWGGWGVSGEMMER